MLLPEAPYPLSGGGPLRSASLLEYLRRRCEVDAIVFREPGAPDPAAAFPPGHVRRTNVIRLPYHPKHLPGKVARNASRLLRGVPPLLDRFDGCGQEIAQLLEGRHYDVAVISHFWCAPYWKQLAPHSQRTVLDLHNIESVLHGRCAQAEPWPIGFAHRVFHKTCAELERNWFPRFSALLVTSEEDAAQVRRIAGDARALVYPNTIPFIELPNQTEQHTIVFSGNLEYHPNMSAVRFFATRIWPLLKSRWPGLTWRLVGKNPDAVKKYTQADPSIQCSGPVDDAVRELASAKVAVVPLLAGSGTRLKILEAWAAGLPVVSTTLGAEGLPVRDGHHLLIADDPGSFAAKVSALLESASERRRIGAAGRLLYEREFTWSCAWNKLDRHEFSFLPATLGHYTG